MKKTIILHILLFACITVSINSQTVLNSLDEIAQYGIEHNIDYKSDQVNVMQAEENIESILLIEHSSISAEGIMAIPDIQSDPTPSFGFSSTLSVPIIEQVSLSGTITDDLSGQIGISLSPLAHSSGSKLSEIEYNKAMVTAESARISAEIGALSAALQWMSANRELLAQKIDAELAEIMYKDDKVRYDLGEITLDDLQESLIEWSESRVELAEKQVNYHNGESSLYSSLGAGSDDISLISLDLETMNESLTELKNSLDPEIGNPLKNDSYLISLLNVQSSENSLKNTWHYEPDLKAGASLGFDSSGNFNVAANIQFSVSLDDFQKNQRNIENEEFLISQAEAEQKLNEAELGYEQVIEAISISEINSEIALLEFEQAKILKLEAEFLKKLGDYSEIELQKSELTLTKAENSLFKALADEFQAWLELKKYM